MNNIYKRRSRHGTKRSKTGCLTCRTRKKKCDEIRPVCKQCSRLSLSCQWMDSDQQLQQKIQEQLELQRQQPQPQPRPQQQQQEQQQQQKQAFLTKQLQNKKYPQPLAITTTSPVVSSQTLSRYHSNVPPNHPQHPLPIPLPQHWQLPYQQQTLSSHQSQYVNGYQYRHQYPFTQQPMTFSRPPRPPLPLPLPRLPPLPMSYSAPESPSMPTLSPRTLPRHSSHPHSHSHTQSQSPLLLQSPSTSRLQPPSQSPSQSPSQLQLQSPSLSQSLSQCPQPLSPHLQALLQSHLLTYVDGIGYVRVLRGKVAYRREEQSAYHQKEKEKE